MKQLIRVITLLLIAGCASIKHKTKTEEAKTEIVEEQERVVNFQTENTTATMQSHAVVVEDQTHVSFTPIDNTKPIEIVDQHGYKKTVHNAIINMGTTHKKEVTQIEETLQIQKKDSLMVEKKQNFFNTGFVKNSYKDKKNTFIDNWLIIILIGIAYVGYTKLKNKDDQNKTA